MKETGNKITRVLPNSMKPIGELLAEIHCRNLGLDDSSKDYQDERSKYLFNFNDEAWGMSMTPSGLIGQNPATPKVQEDYFNLTSKIFGENGFIENLPTNEEQKTKYRRTLRGNIASLVHFILESRYGVKIKGKNGQKSDFEFERDGGLNSREKTILNQYGRLYFTVKTIQALEPLITGTELDMPKVLTQIFGDAWKENTPNFLNPKKIREEFVNKLYLQRNESSNLIKQNPRSVTELPEKKRNPLNKNESYYAPEVGLYFDKPALDLVVRACLDKTVQLEPRNEYVFERTLTDKEINACDLKMPIIVGSVINDQGGMFFLIYGEGQVLKSIQLGLPTVDALILSPDETISMVLKTKQTIDTVKMYQNNLNELRKKINL